MDETCKEKAAFISRYGTLMFEVMQFGLMSLQATFQTTMDRILLKVDNVLLYVDDRVIFS